MAQTRFYGGGNLFSNYHRSPNLPNSCAMIDIDAVSFSSGKIGAIIEDKYKFESATLGNPMVGEGTWQRSKLLTICASLGCPLILHETSTKTCIRFVGNVSEKIADLSEYNIVDTADRIYIEIRWGKPKAVLYRTLGKKLTDLSSDEVFNIATNLKLVLGIPLFIINDVRQDKLVYIREWGKEQTHVIDPIDSDSWQDVYSKIGLI